MRGNSFNITWRPIYHDSRSVKWFNTTNRRIFSDPVHVSITKHIQIHAHEYVFVFEVMCGNIPRTYLFIKRNYDTNWKYNEWKIQCFNCASDSLFFLQGTSRKMVKFCLLPLLTWKCLESDEPWYMQINANCTCKLSQAVLTLSKETCNFLRLCCMLWCLWDGWIRKQSGDSQMQRR